MAGKRKLPLFRRIEVIDAGAKGKAVAKAPDGNIIFLTRAVPGDIVDIQIIKKKRSYMEGVPTVFHNLSDKRTRPVCTHFDSCGGCKWQHMDYQYQLFYKQKEVRNNLLRLGNIEIPEDDSPIIGADAPYYYRNKMEFSFSDNRWISQQEIDSGKEITDRNALGFHIPGKWDKILDITHCHLQEDPSNDIRLSFKQFAVEHQIPFFNLKNQTGLLRTLMIRTTSIGEIMVVVQFFYDDPQKRTLLLDHISNKFPQITSLQYVINTKKNDTIYDQQIVLFKGRDHIFERMEGLRFKIGAKSFYQTNSAQALKLYSIIRDFAALTGKELVYDLYTGTGTIAQFIAKDARKVIGVESVPEAVTDARENAAFNHIDNVDFFTGDIKQLFNDNFIAEHGIPELLITDPPRDGMHKKVIQKIMNIAPERIVYVSCNSATQARDLSLMDSIYKIVKSVAVDMFPQTHHVENVVLLKKRNF